MSSTPYSLRLVPERGLRRLVIASGVLAAGFGTTVIAGLELPGSARLLAAVLWLAVSLGETWLLGRAYGRLRAIRLYAGGEAELTCRDGRSARGSLLGGSVVLGRLAWLRFRTEDGRRYAELLRPNAASIEAWRRLRVLSRHLGAAR